MYVDTHCKNGGGKKCLNFMDINEDKLMVYIMLITIGT